jgi:hypothetical protein
MTKEIVDNLFQKRKQALESIKPQISLKFMYAMEKKLREEEDELLELLNLKTRTDKILEQYSFVLDQQYFEQEFLSKTY